jgi:hypothetical protein
MLHHAKKIRYYEADNGKNVTLLSPSQGAIFCSLDQTRLHWITHTLVDKQNHRKRHANMQREPDIHMEEIWRIMYMRYFHDE